jgi:type I restriction enzyme S subunit
LLPGDLLFVEGNGSADQIGRVALWGGQVRPCVHQNHLIKARPVRRFLGRWMRDWFMSPMGKQFVQAAASSTSGLHTLSISKIENLPVPIPPAVELRRILPRCGEMKREHADGALVLDQQSDALSPLRQSILHAAFTGRLVPQDSRDEPAAALLARLRATLTTTRRPRQRRAAAQPDLIETPA